MWAEASDAVFSESRGASHREAPLCPRVRLRSQRGQLGQNA